MCSSSADLPTASVPTLGIKQAVERLGAERVVFGTDFPCDNGNTVAYELAKIRALRLPAAQEGAVLGGNLGQMLGW
jgi:predicted TIM-barrel fold metal-dependent hydrolase